MIKQVTITNYLNESITLDLKKPEETGIIVKEIKGLGPCKADINSKELATSDGAQFNSARLNSRNIVMDLLFQHKPTIEEVRLKTYKYFPNKKPLKFLIETDKRLAETIGYVESNEPDIFSKDEGTQISIICPDPHFYSAGEDGTKTTLFSGVEPMFEFPFSNESLTDSLIEFGSLQYATEKNVFYDGDAEVGVIIRIHAIGPAGSITIYNTGTRETMKISNDRLSALTGSGIVAGDDIIISTVEGDKYVTLLRNGRETNILNALDRNSDWFKLTKGDNVFAYTADIGSTNLQFRIENRLVYVGV